MWQQFIYEKPFFDEQIDILGCKKLLVCRKIHRSTKKVSFSALLLQNWYLTKKIWSAWSHKKKLFSMKVFHCCSEHWMCFLWPRQQNTFSVKNFFNFCGFLKITQVEYSWQKTLVLLNNFFLFVSRKTCNLSIVLIRNILIKSSYFVRICNYTFLIFQCHPQNLK